MPRLDEKNREALEALREDLPAQSSFGWESVGVWEPGRVFLDEFGHALFLKLDQSRTATGVTAPLRYVGDGVRNTVGWGDRTAPVPSEPEVRLLAPVLGFKAHF